MDCFRGTSRRSEKVLKLLSAEKSQALDGVRRAKIVPDFGPPLHIAQKAVETLRGFGAPLELRATGTFCALNFNVEITFTRKRISTRTGRNRHSLPRINRRRLHAAEER